MKNTLMVVLTILVYGCAASDVVYEPQHSNGSAGSMGDLRVEIRTPSQNQLVSSGERSFVVEGGASNFGGVRYLDLIFVLDSSKSLTSSDPKGYLAKGATGLVKNFAPDSDINIGVVSFNTAGKVLRPLTQDRAFVVETLQRLPRSGGTDVASGIRKALEEFEKNARPDSTRVIMLFTDGQSNASRALAATEEAKAQGVAVHTLLLGSNEKGATILQQIARGTGASFVQVRDPAKLPEAFLNLRTTGVESVALQVNGGVLVPARLTGGTFTRRVLLKPGENNIVAVATSMSGKTAQSAVTINSGPPNCAALEVTAMTDGQPTVSINERSVEIVVDGSRSMWGRMESQPKMSVAKDILQDVADWFPGELNLALRAYGNASASELNDCSDSQLLVGFGDENRGQIREAVTELSPLGQTPLAYALNQVGKDFAHVSGERAVVLVTDGIESCGGDPVAAAQALSKQDVTIHVIGFGLGSRVDEDIESLAAIADASGGRFFLAQSAQQLKDALVDTVGTPFQVLSGPTVVADGALGSGEPILLPDGDYQVQVKSSPPHVLPVSLVAGERVTMTLAKEAGIVSHAEQRSVVGYTPCTAPVMDATAQR
jgi:Mg-chelatase subunit ChlD